MSENGLERRYEVRKINDPTGKHNECRYFVLDPLHDPLARKALETYRFEARMAGLDALSADLRDWLVEIDGTSVGPREQGEVDVTDVFDARLRDAEQGGGS